MAKKSQKPPQLFLDSYLAFIRNSIGSRAYRNYYAVIDGKKTDVAQEGLLSCAYFVSSVLRLFNMIKTYHLTVQSTVGEIEKNPGWSKVALEQVQPGDVIAWSTYPADQIVHPHIGFFLEDGQAVSTKSGDGTVWQHSLDVTPGRAIEGVYHFTFTKDHTR